MTIDADELAAIGHEIRTQDNCCTAHAMFVVQQRRRIYGMDSDYVEDVAWLYDDECIEVDSAEAAKLEAQWQIDWKEPDGYRRVAYIDVWEFVTVCFTRKAAEAYIAKNAHNLKDPRVYVDSGYRNPEWQMLREHLSGRPS